MPSTCEFKFDRRQLIYYDGETINAWLTFKTKTEKTFREVYIEFSGRAKVRWSELRTRNSEQTPQTYYVYYTGNETYIENRTVLHGEGKLLPGTYEYTFSITLPPQLPSSCVETYGHISYELSLVIDRQQRYNNIFRQPITVLQNLNLNLSPEYLLPLQVEDVKYICFWPCKSGPIVSTLTIPHGGYAPGQNIKYSLKVDNQSQGYDMDGIELRFMQVNEFTATSPIQKTRSYNVTLADAAPNGTVLRLSKRLFEGMLFIPPVPPTTLGQHIIRVHYMIEFFIKSSAFRKNSKVFIPITIGTVPLVQTATNPENIAFIIPTAPTPDTPDSGPPDYNSIKPPSYESATTVKNQFIDEDVDAHNRIGNFLPQYPMYTNFSLPTAPPLFSNSNELPSTSTGLEAHRNILNESNELPSTADETTELFAT